jgi:hypothetical protein
VQTFAELLATALEEISIVLNFVPSPRGVHHPHRLTSNFTVQIFAAPDLSVNNLHHTKISRYTVHLYIFSANKNLITNCFLPDRLVFVAHNRVLLSSLGELHNVLIDTRR